MRSSQYPPPLAPFRSQIEATEQPYVRIVATPGTTLPWQSKFGGTPYFPIDAPHDWFAQPGPNRLNHSPWPKARPGGYELHLLAQINFAEVPRLPPFPDHGILQVFIDPRLWTDLERALRIIWHEDVYDEPELVFHDFGPLVPVTPSDGPHDRRTDEYALTFHSDIDVISFADFRFDRAFAGHRVDGTPLSELLRSRLRRHYLHFARPDIHVTRNRMGGYHYSQNEQDPRHGRSLLDDSWDDSVLLLQFDGCDIYSWGDLGSAQLFIRRSDLVARNFEDLLYHWDST